MKTNTKKHQTVMDAPRTHEGARAYRIDAEQQLRRSVMSCMLWEDGFYESGEEIAKRIGVLVCSVQPQRVPAIVIDAREKQKLRHVPLWIVRQMATLKEHKEYVAATLERVIQRADELTEFVALYWKEKRQPLSAQVKKGLAAAFQKFDAYQLGKYNRDGAIKLKDVLFLCHAKPKDEAQAALWKKLIDGTLESPDTWEVALSAGKEKKGTWERLIAEKKLGALALLRNLRNMKEHGVADETVRAALAVTKTDRVLPFRFISAAKHAPQLEDALEQTMFRSLSEAPKLKGKTALVLDNSGSMNEKISGKSELTRRDAAGALAILLREVCENVSVIGFSTFPKIVPPRRGFALAESYAKSTDHGGTNTADALNFAKKEGYDRIIVVTDEQSHQNVEGPGADKKGYFINVACNQNGIGYGPWTHIDGWSESVVDFIQAMEAE